MKIKETQTLIIVERVVNDPVVDPVVDPMDKIRIAFPKRKIEMPNDDPDLAISHFEDKIFISWKWRYTPK